MKVQSPAPKVEDFPVPVGVFVEHIRAVHHYTDRLFKFRISRPPSFRFRSGEFIMLGLPNAERPVFRAFSMSSPAWDDEIEFYSIKVSDGPLTEHLQKVQVGDKILLRKKPTGTLVLDALRPGKRLYLISTGTGIAPFASLIRDPETYDRFDQVVLIHTCREVVELSYGYDVVKAAKSDPLVGDQARSQLDHFASATRQESTNRGRVTTLIDSGALFERLNVPRFDPAQDRIMICGSVAMNKDVRQRVEAAGFTEGANNKPGEFVVEKAFVE